MFKYSYHQQSMKSQNNSWGVQPLSMDDGLELAQYTMIDFRHGTKVNIIANFAIVVNHIAKCCPFCMMVIVSQRKELLAFDDIQCLGWNIWRKTNFPHRLMFEFQPDCENEEWKTIGCISSFQVPTRHRILCAAGFKRVLALDSIAVSIFTNRETAMLSN